VGSWNALLSERQEDNGAPCYHPVEKFSIDVLGSTRMNMRKLQRHSVRFNDDVEAQCARFRRSCRREVLALDDHVITTNASEAACVDSKCPPDEEARPHSHPGPPFTHACGQSAERCRASGVLRPRRSPGRLGQGATPSTCPVRVWPARCWPADGGSPDNRPAHAASGERREARHVCPDCRTPPVPPRVHRPWEGLERATAWVAQDGLSCSGRGRSVVVRVIASARCRLGVIVLGGGSVGVDSRSCLWPDGLPAHLPPYRPQCGFR